MVDPDKAETETNNMALSVVSLMSSQSSQVRRSTHKNNAASNPKKLFEEHQTSRRIRLYLERLPSRTFSEKELQEMSYNCEPPANLAQHSAPPPLLSTAPKQNSPKPQPEKTKAASTSSVNSDTSAPVPIEKKRSSDSSLSSEASDLTKNHETRLSSQSRGERQKRKQLQQPAKILVGSFQNLQNQRPDFAIDLDNLEGDSAYDDEHGQVSMV